MRLYGDLGVILQEQHRQYEAFYAQRFLPRATVDEIPVRAANLVEMVPAGVARESGEESDGVVSGIQGLARPDLWSRVAKIEGEIDQITEALDRGDSSASEDEEPERRNEGGLVPGGGPVGRTRASEGGVDQVLDPRIHALLTPCPRNSYWVPVAYLHMLYARPNGQGRLTLQSSPPLDLVPLNINQKRVYHTLHPLPHFPSTNAGYRTRYYR